MKNVCKEPFYKKMGNIIQSLGLQFLKQRWTVNNHEEDKTEVGSETLYLSK